MTQVTPIDDPYPVQQIPLGDLVYKWHGYPEGSRGAVVCLIYDDIVRHLRDPQHQPNRNIRFSKNPWVRFENLYPPIHRIHLTMTCTLPRRMVNPLIVWPDGPVFRVDRGNQRLTVVRALGWSHVPCRVAKDERDVGNVLRRHPYESIGKS